MERTPENQQPAQAELDLSQMEPITPKKAVKAEPSFLDKAKSLFAKKETAEMPRFHERKEPTFGQPKETAFTSEPKTTVLPVIDNTPTQNEVEITTPHIETEATAAEQVEIEVSEKTPEAENSENVIIASPTIAKAKSKLTHPENWAIMQKLPEKHRRLFVAIAAGVLVLLALLWLKPSSETVEEIQANQSNSMPIEFQSLVPNQQNQASTAVDNSQAAVPAESVNTSSEINTSQTVAATPVENTSHIQPVAHTDKNEDTRAAELARLEKLKAEEAKLKAEKAKAEQLKAEQEAKLKAEKLKKEELAAKEKAEKAKAEKLKAEQKAKSEKAKSTSGVPVVEAKPAGNNAKSSVPVVEATKATGSATNKTLTVQKGVSLMQVFRDNNLNISDIGAMSRAKGAENVLSSFKPGEKVQVSVNSQGRVNTMRLPNGSTFVRQADGSYKYNK